MLSQKLNQEGSQLYKIQGSLSINEVKTIHSKLLELITDSKNIDIELSEVEECDAAGIQLILSAQKNSNSVIRVSGISDAVKKTALSIGVNFHNQINSGEAVLNEEDYYDCR